MRVLVQYRDARCEWLPWRVAIQRRKQLSDWSLKRLIELSKTILDEAMTETDWPRLFQVNTSAWRDFAEQAERRPNVKSGIGLAMSAYRRCSHPRDCGEPWYRDPAQGAEKPRMDWFEMRREEDAKRAPRLTEDEIAARAGEYLRLVGRERK